MGDSVVPLHFIFLFRLDHILFSSSLLSFQFPWKQETGLRFSDVSVCISFLPYEAALFPSQVSPVPGKRALGWGKSFSL